MIFHCQSYNYNIYRITLAVFAMLLGLMYAYGDSVAPISFRPRIALLGDSMTWIGGDSCQNETGWSHVLNQSGLAEHIDVYARSGATWTNTKTTTINPSHYTELLHDDNVIYNQAIRLIQRADSSDCEPNIIILFAGANDAWFADKRPGIYEEANSQTEFSLELDPGSVTSLSGSIRLVSETLLDRFPGATLLFITPLQMSKTDAKTIFKVSDIIERTASQIGYPCLRADKETGISHDIESASPTYTYDGVHTNPAGAKILGDYITQYLLNFFTIASNHKINIKKSTTP